MAIPNISSGHIPLLAGAFALLLLVFLGGFIFLNKISSK